MEEASTVRQNDDIEFANDIAQLGPQALRIKYKGEANSHAAMKRRCRAGDFTLDAAWDDFRSFLRDMGPRPNPDATLDRMEHRVRRYGPGLCRWAGKSEQTRNRSNTVWVPFEEEQLTLSEFANRLGAPYTTIHAALQRGEAPNAIARRLSAERERIGSYRPAWIDTDEALGRWRVEYEGWLRKVVRSRRDQAPPEVYTAILVSEALFRARRRLRTAGFDEMTPEEYEQAAIGWRRELRVSSEGINWIKHALRSLSARDAKLASRLLPCRGDWESVRLFEHWLISPLHP